MKKTQFVSLNKIIQYLMLGAVAMSLGYFLKEGIVAIACGIFLILLLFKKVDNLVLFLIFWLFIYNYYLGQNWIHNELISKYLIKGQFYTIITFIVFVRKGWFRDEFSKKLFSWVLIFLMIMLFSNILHLNFNPGFINQVYFIFMFFLILNIPGNKFFERNLLSLVVAIGLLEVVVSILQVSQILAPPIKLSVDSQFLWEAGLDDVASGTFGAGSSNVTSWLSTILFFTFFSFGVYRKKVIIVLASFIFMLQYVTVDSKTALVVSILAFILLLYNLKIFTFYKVRNYFYVSLIISFVFITQIMITSYYENIFNIGVGAVNTNVANSAELVLSNIQDWGKIAGFKNITEDYIDTNPFYLLIGYGISNFDYDTNGGRIENMDTPIMQLNNITRSRSSFISIYGELGIPGLLMLIWLFLILFRNIQKRNYNTVLGNSFKQSGIAVLFGSMIFMFLYGGHKYNDMAFLMFFILYASVLRIENKYIETQFLLEKNGK